MLRTLVASAAIAILAPAVSSTHGSGLQYGIREYPVRAGSHPHDVAPARDGGIWYTAQATGELGWLDPHTGRTRLTRLGGGSAPHGVLVGPDGAPWITDGGLNAIVRVGLPRRIGRPQWEGRRSSPADSRTRCSAYLVGLSGPCLGERVERGQGRPLRPALSPLARVAASGREPHALRSVRRRPRQGVADRLRQRCPRPLRSVDSALHHRRPAVFRRGGSAAPRPARRGVGGGVRYGQTRRRPNPLNGEGPREAALPTVDSAPTT